MLTRVSLLRPVESITLDETSRAFKRLYRQDEPPVRIGLERQIPIMSGQAQNQQCLENNGSQMSV